MDIISPENCPGTCELASERGIAAGADGPQAAASHVLETKEVGMGMATSYLFTKAGRGHKARKSLPQ